MVWKNINISIKKIITMINFIVVAVYLSVCNSDNFINCIMFIL
jgi:hypothetical protein